MLGLCQGRRTPSTRPVWALPLCGATRGEETRAGELRGKELEPNNLSSFMMKCRFNGTPPALPWHPLIQVGGPGGVSEGVNWRVFFRRRVSQRQLNLPLGSCTGTWDSKPTLIGSQMSFYLCPLGIQVSHLPHTFSPRESGFPLQFEMPATCCVGGFNGDLIPQWLSSCSCIRRVFGSGNHWSRWSGME